MTYERHNLSALGDGTNTADFFTGAFTLSNGILGPAVLVVIFVVAFSILSKANTTRDSLAGSLFLSFGLSIIMSAMGMLLPVYTLGLGVILGLIAFSYVFN